MGSVGRGKGGGAVGVVKPRAQQTPLATQPTDTGQDTDLRVPKGNRHCLAKQSTECHRHPKCTKQQAGREYLAALSGSTAPTLSTPA